jgi:hypothetical protein
MGLAVMLTGQFDRTGINAFFDNQPEWHPSPDVRRGYDRDQRDYTCTLAGSAFSAYVSFIGTSAEWLSKRGRAWYVSHLIWCAQHGGFTAPLASVPARSSGVIIYQGPLFR